MRAEKDDTAARSLLDEERDKFGLVLAKTDVSANRFAT